MTRWAWTVVGQGVHESGSVHAVNARDALGRVLTEESDYGVCRGEALKLTPAVLEQAREEVDGIHEFLFKGVYVHVRMLSSLEADTYVMSQMHQEAIARAFSPAIARELPGCNPDVLRVHVAPIGTAMRKFRSGRVTARI